MPRYWVSFDLGLRGNYDDLYGWLDSQGAKDCGDGVATFVSNKSREQIIRELKNLARPANLSEVSGHRTAARIYLITRKEGGKFIVGKRRAAPWTGYAVTEQESEIEA